MEDELKTLQDKIMDLENKLTVTTSNYTFNNTSKIIIDNCKTEPTNKDFN